jgi:hypothetical protein
MLNLYWGMFFTIAALQIHELWHDVFLFRCQTMPCNEHFKSDIETAGEIFTLQG